MDLFLKKTTNDIITVVIVSFFFIIFFPITFLMYIENKVTNYLSKKRSKKTVVKNIQSRWRNFLDLLDNPYYPKLILTKKHINYILHINNDHINEKIYSLKTMYQLIYFSKFIGNLFYHLNFQNKFIIKKNHFDKKKGSFFPIDNIDFFDFFWLLAYKYYTEEIQYDKLLLSLLEYTEYTKKEDFLYDLSNIIIVSKFSETKIIDLLTIIFSKFKNNNQLLEKFPVDKFLNELFFRISLEEDSEIIIKKIHIIFELLTKNEDKLILLSNILKDYFNNNKYNSKLKIVLSLLVMLNENTDEYLNEIIIIYQLKEDKINEIKKYIMFFKLDKLKNKNLNKEKIKKI